MYKKKTNHFATVITAVFKLPMRLLCKSIEGDPCISCEQGPDLVNHHFAYFVWNSNARAPSEVQTPPTPSYVYDPFKHPELRVC